jgi:predicted nucleotidyltransferase
MPSDPAPGTWLIDLVRVTDVARSRLDGCSVYLSGSRAIGMGRLDSDVDVVVVLPDAAGEADALGLCTALADHLTGDGQARQVAVPKVVWWHDLVRCYAYEAASFGLPFWHHAILLAGEERRTGALCDPGTAADSALSAFVRWTAATLVRLWGRAGQETITRPAATIGRAARSLLLMRDGVFVVSYLVALSMVLRPEDEALLALRDAMASTGRHSITAPAVTWAHALQELLGQAAGIAGEGDWQPAADRLWLHLDRPLDHGTPWRLVSSASQLALCLRDPDGQPPGPWTTSELAMLALLPRRRSFSARALLAHLRFNRYNKWLDGMLAQEPGGWAAHRARCMDYLARTKSAWRASASITRAVRSMDAALRESGAAPVAQVRRSIMDRWLAFSAAVDEAADSEGI